MTDGFGRDTMGSLDWLVVVLLITAGVLSVYSPWVFFIGGRFTPLAQWTGYGKLHSSAGGDYGIYLYLSQHQSEQVDTAFGAKPNLKGSAILCTPQGAKYEYRVEGRVDAWLHTEGKPTGLYLVNATAEKRSFDLRGKWRQGNLVMDDKGSLSRWLRSGSSPRRKSRRLGLAASKGEHAQVTVSYGSRSDFNGFCQNEIAQTTLSRTSTPFPIR